MNYMVLKKVIFYSISLIIPVIILGSVEIVLRLMPGYESSSLTETIRGTEHGVVNSTYFNRYFNSFKPSTSISPFLSERDHSTFRILALGGSSMAGYPYSHHYSIPSILELNLKKSFPDTQFEVLNFSVTAFNSFGVIDIAKRIYQLDPDAIILYSGHNEFYGALGSASTDGMFDSGFLRRLYLNIYPLALFQYGNNFIKSESNASLEDSSRTTTMSKMIRNSSIPFKSGLYMDTMSDFEINLQKLIAASNETDIPVIVSTVVSNLKDQPPLDGSTLATGFFNRGHDFINKNNVDSARVMFLKARDYDEVRFRAPGDINRIILENRNRSHVRVIDIEESYRDLCISGIEDDSCFTDHLHPNLNGYGYIAEKFLDKLIPLVSSKNAQQNSSPSIFIIPTLDPLEELISSINLRILKSAPPFKADSSDHAQSLESILMDLSDETDSLSKAAIQILTNNSHPAKVYDELSTFQSVSSISSFYYNWLQWNPLNENIIQTGLQKLIKDQSIDPSIEPLLLLCANRFKTGYCYNLLGALYLQQKEYNSAKSFLKVVEKQSPDDPSMLFNFAVLYYETGDLENALLYQNKYQRVVDQSDAVTGYNSEDR